MESIDKYKVEIMIFFQSDAEAISLKREIDKSQEISKDVEDNLMKVIGRFNETFLLGVESDTKLESKE